MSLTLLTAGALHDWDTGIPYTNAFWDLMKARSQCQVVGVKEQKQEH